MLTKNALISFKLGSLQILTIIFKEKTSPNSYQTISLNNIQVERAPYQKHLGFILDEKLNFTLHIVNAISKVNKGISIIKNSDIARHENR